MGTISDYAPSTAPMVPSLIVHCVNEVDLRGLNEVGIYRIPGSEKEVRELKVQNSITKCKYLVICSVGQTPYLLGTSCLHL
jgi:predicted HAD superfamily phosphohydrolase